MQHETPPDRNARRFARSMMDHIAKLALVLLVAEVAVGPFSASPAFRLALVVGLGLVAGAAFEGFILWMERDAHRARASRQVQR